MVYHRCYTLFRVIPLTNAIAQNTPHMAIVLTLMLPAKHLCDNAEIARRNKINLISSLMLIAALLIQQTPTPNRRSRVAHVIFIQPHFFAKEIEGVQ